MIVFLNFLLICLAFFKSPLPYERQTPATLLTGKLNVVI